MATLAESFLADLDDLSDDEVEALPQDHEAGSGDEAMPDIENLHYDDLSSIATLTTTDRYTRVLDATRAALAADDAEEEMGGWGGEGKGQGPSASGRQWTGPVEEDPTYKLLVECNQLSVDIDAEIAAVYNFLRDHYRPKFPELESLVQTPLEYAAVVKAIGNEMDVTLIDLDSLLAPATVMVVTVTATTTSGQPLSEEELQKVLSACDMASQLAADKSLMQRLVQRRMDSIAPNLSAAVGTEIAAQCMGLAGGLLALATMPACNLQVLGAKRKTLAGFSSASAAAHRGFVYESALVQGAPPSLRARAQRLVGSKCALLARMDAYGQDPGGGAGREMREEMARKIEKWQEPPPAKQTKVLPAPDANEQRRRRGGRRYRKMKERYGLTELKKQANRMAFNQAEEEFYDGEDTIGLGVIGKDGSGRLRSVAIQQRQKLSAKSAKKFAARSYGSSGGTSGLSSSLAFTPIQGIELANPMQAAAAADRVRDGAESYFSEYSGFRSAKK